MTTQLINNNTKSEPTINWKFKLHSGDFIPMIGFGTSKITNYDILKNAIDYALEAGIRHIDTAQYYGNEDLIGQALKELLLKYNLNRADLFITSKLNSTLENPNAYEEVKNSLKKLQLDYLDLYLIHFPVVTKAYRGSIIYSKGPKNIEYRAARWQELVKAQKDGLVRNIGVSNYAVKHLVELLGNCFGVKPAVNQIQWHPFHHPEDILKICQKENILVVGWSSLGGTDNDRAHLRDNLQVRHIAEKLGKSTSQVLLRWSLQQGVAVLPKSTSRNHILENTDTNFELPEDDFNILSSFEQKKDGFGANEVLKNLD